MKLLGAILAGGAATRFGSDKASALFEGRALIDHVVEALRPQTDSLVIVGRDWPGAASMDDRPALGLGPLGGLAAVLRHAQARGFDAVLVAPCDTLGLPADLVQRLAPGPSVAAGQRTIGLWPATLAPILLDWLEAGRSRAIRDWVAATGAREVDCGTLHNINHADDLA